MSEESGRYMNQQKFDTFMAAAQTLPEDYAKGYQRGLRRYFHGEKFGTTAEHEQWVGMDGHRQEMGDGYRDGFAGNPPRGFHGNLGNLNAQGDLPANSHLNIRVNSQAKAGWVKKASAEGMTLTQWVIKTLDAAAK